MRVVVVVFEPPSSDRARKMMRLVEELAGHGTEVLVYLLGDGVYWAVKGWLDGVIDGEVLFFAGESDLEARGIRGEILSERVNVVLEVVGRLVEDVMEWAERVISV